MLCKFRFVEMSSNTAALTAIRRKSPRIASMHGRNASFAKTLLAIARVAKFDLHRTAIEKTTLDIFYR
jgi:hypothetical protein